MISTSHAIYNLALLRQKGDSAVTKAIIAGALVPDLLTYIFFIVTYFIMGYSMSEIWDHLYFNSGWTTYITLTHSLWIWPLGLLTAYIYKKRWAMYFFLSGTTHILFDFFVHTDDAYAHFWPFTDWKFNSGVSYWNPAEYGNIVGMLDSIVILGLLVYLYRTTESKYVRWAFISLMVVYIAFIVRRIFFPFEV